MFFTPPENTQNAGTKAGLLPPNFRCTQNLVQSSWLFAPGVRSETAFINIWDAAVRSKMGDRSQRSSVPNSWWLLPGLDTKSFSKHLLEFAPNVCASAMSANEPRLHRHSSSGEAQLPYFPSGKLLSCSRLRPYLGYSRFGPSRPPCPSLQSGLRHVFI